jgi:hypothetical protein
MKRLTLFPVVAVFVACAGEATGPLTDDVTLEPSLAVGGGGGPGSSMMAQVAQHMVDNGRTSGAFFLPPFQEDEDGNLTFAGTGGFIFASFWSPGQLKGLCFFGTESQTNFFRVGPKEVAMNHVNGAASAGVFLRFAEDGTPLPSVSGSGKLNMKIQGTLAEDTFYDEFLGANITFLYIDQPTSAQVWSGVAKVGEEGMSPDLHLKCGFTDDAKGNRRSGHFSLK